ncbi:MAG: Fic family protein [Erysipelotrichaceae bacterium]|nr:Fic family protein [Erysipelotrichaceae bacterium]
MDMLCQKLLKEYQENNKNGIYALTQYTFAYHSNKIEGNTLSIDETKNLFLAETLPQCTTKDIEETIGHFRMFNEMLCDYMEPLSEEIIKKYHYCLKSDVFEDMANGYPCGEYKNRKNFVSDITTATPNQVEMEMSKLLNWYHNCENNLENIVQFHVYYENIHPFCDGNGRTGRIILFKECLKNGIIPPMIFYKNKQAYHTALNKAQKTDNIDELLTIIKESQNDYSQMICI